jgi:hypothetical protein
MRQVALASAPLADAHAPSAASLLRHRLNVDSFAMSAHPAGLQLDPASEQLKSALAEAKAAASRPQRPTNLFSSPELILKLAMDPRGKELLGQPDFMRMLSDVQQDPSTINMYLKDPRMQLVSMGWWDGEVITVEMLRLGMLALECFARPTQLCCDRAWERGARPPFHAVRVIARWLQVPVLCLRRQPRKREPQCSLAAGARAGPGCQVRAGRPRGGGGAASGDRRA